MEPEVLETEELEAVDIYTAELKSLLRAKSYDAAMELAITCYGDAPESRSYAFALLAARMRSVSLSSIYAGETVNKTTDEMLELIKNEHLLLRILNSVTDNLEKGRLCNYTILVIDGFLNKPKEQLAGWISENARALKDFACRIIPQVAKRVERRGEYFIKFAELLQHHEMYDEARVLYEQAERGEYSAVDCRLGVLLCVLNAQSEKEIATAELFDEELPEYERLLDACHKRKKKYFEELAQKNAEHKKGTPSEEAKRHSVHLKVNGSTLLTLGGWSLGVLCVLFVAFMLSFGQGMLASELLSWLPFVGGGDAGIFCEIFDAFVLVALVLNMGGALGMTTNLSSLLCKLTAPILRLFGAKYHLPYSARRRTYLVCVNLLLCWAVSLFGKQFSLHTPLLEGWSVALAALMGAVALIFCFFIFRCVMALVEKCEVGAQKECGGAEAGHGLELLGLLLCIGGAYLVVKTQGGVLSGTGVEGVAFWIFAVLGLVLLASGIALKFIYLSGNSFSDEPFVFHALFSSALAIFVYRSLFFEEIGWHLTFIVLFGTVALINLIPSLFLSSGEHRRTLRYLSHCAVFICMLAVGQHVLCAYDFSALAEDFAKIFPSTQGLMYPEVASVGTMVVQVFFLINLAVVILPSFVGFVFVRVLAFPIRRKKKSGGVAGMDREEFARSFAKKLFFSLVLALFSLGIWHLLTFLSAFFANEIGPTLAKGAIVAVGVILCYCISIFFYYLMHWLRRVASVAFEWLDFEYIWSRGYFLGTLSLFAAVLAVLRLMELGSLGIVQTAEQTTAYLLLALGILCFVVSATMRMSGKAYAGTSDTKQINAVEVGFGLVYMGLAVALGVLLYFLGASHLIFVPLGAVVLHAGVGLFVGFTDIRAAEDWW